jgi:DDE family transposase
VVAKVEWHSGELYPRVGFLVSNLARPAERVVAFYNQRGTCAQFIKEGKGAVKWTRLSCRTSAANAVRLQLHVLAYNLGNFMRTLAMPDQPARDVDQDRREGRQPWPLRDLPDGRGRSSGTNVRRDPVADRPAAGRHQRRHDGRFGQVRRAMRGEVCLGTRKAARFAVCRHQQPASIAIYPGCARFAIA